VTDIGFDDESEWDMITALVPRNKRFRSLFLFDARQMLMSRLCSDEFGVLWSYFIDSSAGDDDGAVPDNIASIRFELVAIVNERRRDELRRPALASYHVCSLQSHIADQTNQISDLQRSSQMLVEQNQQMQQQMQQMQEQNQQRQEQMQEQMRQMHALLMTHVNVQSADVDERDKRAVKRRRTGQ
jgi:hypothetical protein